MKHEEAHVREQGNGQWEVHLWSCGPALVTVDVHGDEVHVPGEIRPRHVENRGIDWIRRIV